MLAPRPLFALYHLASGLTGHSNTDAFGFLKFSFMFLMLFYDIATSICSYTTQISSINIHIVSIYNTYNNINNYYVINTIFLSHYSLRHYFFPKSTYLPTIISFYLYVCIYILLVYVINPSQK